MSQTLLLSSNATDFTTNLSPPIPLENNKRYEAALLSIDLYNSIPNITPANNKFKYSPDDGITWKIISLNTGSYQFQAINDEIQRQMVINNDYDKDSNEFYVSIVANVSELKSVVHISNKLYRVDFTIENSIGSVLGFDAVVSYGYNVSNKIVNITNITSVLVNVDIISGSYINSNQSPAIYSFSPNSVPPGYFISERPFPPIYYSLNRSTINSIKVWLTDQNGNFVDLRGETVTVRLYIKEI
jgi:hypothetical protein